MKRVRAICVATMPDGRRLEGPEAQVLLSSVMDDGWEGGIETAPTFTYRLATEADSPDLIAYGETYLIERPTEATR